MVKHPSPEIPKFESLAVAGYKSINEKQTIAIKPLTILAGANSGGKSSLMQPLLLLKQTLEAPYDPGSLLLNGQNVKFTAVDQLLPRKGKTTVAKRFQVEIGFGGRRVDFAFRHALGQGVDVDSISLNADEGSFTLTAGMDLAHLLKDIKRSKLFKDFEFPDVAYRVKRERCFLSIEATIADGRFSYVTFHPGSVVEPLISRLIHVPGLRGNPQRYYPTTGVGQTFPGTFEVYVASVIQDWQSRKDDRLLQLGRHLELLGLTWKVQATRVDDTQVELKVGRLPHERKGGASDLVSIADVGFGVSQTLPVLVALLVAEPGQTVYLEQPEIHLHPRAQRMLGVILAEAARKGVIVIVETHSALLLRTIQTLVAKGELARELVKLHWVTRDSSSGFTQVNSADLDETGAFGDWPADFDETELAADDDYLEAAEARLFAGAE